MILEQTAARQTKLLSLLRQEFGLSAGLTNLKLLIGTTVVTFAIYAVFYTLVYRITSNSYYSIVAGAKEEHT